MIVWYYISGEVNMIDINLLKKVSLTAFLLIIVAVLLFYPIISVSAETDDNLVLETTYVSETETITEISNIQNFLRGSRSLFYRSSNKSISEQKLNEYYRAIGLNDKEIATISDERRADYLNAQSMQVARIVGDGETEIDSGVSATNKPLVNYSRLFRVPARDKADGDLGFRYEITSVWLDEPAQRLKDMIAIAKPDNASFGTVNEREGYLYYSEDTYDWSHYIETREYTFSFDRPDQIAPYDEKGVFGAIIDVPSDNLISRYQYKYNNIGASLSIVVYSPKTFNIWAAYGHKYIAGSISVSKSSGTSITFNSFVTNYPAVFLSSSSAF